MKKGFTLAEVLITLGIIGVVAAMTMPTLIQNHQKQVYVTRLKKAVNVLENMPRKLMADEGVTNFSDTKLMSEGFNLDCVAANGNPYICGNSGGNRDEFLGCVIGNGRNPVDCAADGYAGDGYGNYSIIEAELVKNFNVIKTCTGAECNIPYQSAYLNGNKLSTYGSNSKSIINFLRDSLYPKNCIGIYTADGFIFYFSPDADDAGRTLGFEVYIDVNGEKGPNQQGRDLFRYFLKERSFLADSFGNRIITNGWKMDY